MPHELPKAYDPRAIEARWAEFWVKEKLFEVATPPASDESHPSPKTGERVGHPQDSNSPLKPKEGLSGPPTEEKQVPRLGRATSKRAVARDYNSVGTGTDHPVFSMLLPPPNVTGRLHMGHMLNQTEMDIVTRWHRMRGHLTLWLPGTDHAGIATQMMVERQLAVEGKNRRDIGREAFIARVWEWRKQYGSAILEQMKRLGASVDWSREYFTMHEHLSRAVRLVFVRLYEEGLIYRGKYIVNWCPRCGTAISDLEVEHEETPGKLYEIRYPVSAESHSSPKAGERVGHPKSAGLSGPPTDESPAFITVATTRPETMLGDTAVAVNARDARYTALHGKHVLLPLMNREIPIILDEIANPEFGTGAVKVTPFHDANDFQAGQRHNLPQIEVIDETGHMNENAGQYAGLDRFETRERIVEDLRQQGLLAGVKDYIVPLGKCQRCKTVVEPRLSTQWFVAVNKNGKSGGPSLAWRAKKVVENNWIRFTPENYKTIYLNWMENIYDWTISRQLWWGHRIPAWHCADCGGITVAMETPEKCSHCGKQNLVQDPDVLDTWFSSALLPFTTLGWPEKTRDLEVFYPTTLLITGFDILFFWVARMIMMGCWFMGDEGRLQPDTPEGRSRLQESVPFKEVYIHALVRDAERQKMSKTKGNVLDPIEVIEQYGTDAVRFTLAAMASPGTDIAFNPARTEGYRAFANKIWNAARFIFMNMDRIGQRAAPEAASAPGDALEDRWIVSRLHRTIRDLDQALETYRFDEAAHRVYTFFWGDFCDWYIELSKLRLGSADQQVARTTISFVTGIFDQALRLLSPFMPFITEELWHALYEGKPPKKSIAVAEFPQHDDALISDSVEEEMAVLQDLIVSIRQIRHDLGVEAKASVPVRLFSANGIRELVEANREAVQKLANVASMQFVDEELAHVPGARHTARFDVVVEYEKKVDKAAESARLQKELTKLEGEMANAQRQLSNEHFLAKAPAHVVEGIRRRLGELEILIPKTRAALKGLE